MTGPGTELPVPDTVDVRTGPEVSDALLSVLPLLGEWHGEGLPWPTWPARTGLRTPTANTVGSVGPRGA